MQHLPFKGAIISLVARSVSRVAVSTGATAGSTSLGVVLAVRVMVVMVIEGAVCWVVVVVVVVALVLMMVTTTVLLADSRFLAVVAVFAELGLLLQLLLRNISGDEMIENGSYSTTGSSPGDASSFICKKTKTIVNILTSSTCVSNCS